MELDHVLLSGLGGDHDLAGREGCDMRRSRLQRRWEGAHWYFLGAVAAIVVMLAADKAFSQEEHDVTDPQHFYSYWCCNRKDCTRSSAGEVQILPTGYWIEKTKELIEWGNGKIKSIPKEHDTGDFHVCVNTVGKVRCLYIPTPQG